MKTDYSVKVIRLHRESGGGFQALVPQFGRGVVGYGDTQTEAVKDLLTVLPDFLKFLADTGQDVPEPEVIRETAEFSGKFNVRIPKLLHAELVELAEENEVSLNQLVTMLLAQAAVSAKRGHFLRHPKLDEASEPRMEYSTEPAAALLHVSEKRKRT